MKNLLRIEELGQFLLAIYLFSQTEYAWWLFPALLLAPDISALGYLGGPKLGATIYNIFHHKFVAISLLIAGYYTDHSVWVLIGLILFAHAAMDRIFEYGLKFPNDFKHTHLGWIGRKQDDPSA